MRKIVYYLVAIFMALPLVTSCGDDVDEVSKNDAKEMSVTSGASNITSSSADLKGFANNANGVVGFCISSTEQNPTPQNSQTVNTNLVMSDNSYTITINNLMPSTVYYYRAYATKDNVYILAKEVKKFTTSKGSAAAKTAVDLGLSVKWASCNVGAGFPEEYGDYFAWGETKPKSKYDWLTYKYCNGTDRSMTKYCSSTTYGKVDNKNILDMEDDAAHVNWGSTWRMPTTEEFDELMDQSKCTWTWMSQNNVNGYKVTSKSNGNSIFLPAAGEYDDTDDYDPGIGEKGKYWSCTRSKSHQDGAYVIFFEKYDVHEDGDYRNCGLPVRAVCP